MITPDGTRMPWVLARDNRWHRRPPEDTWQARVLEQICTTVCGQRVDPLYVASVTPTYQPDICPDCTPEDTA